MSEMDDQLRGDQGSMLEGLVESGLPEIAAELELEDEQDFTAVRDFVSALVKAIRVAQIYASANPLVGRFKEEAATKLGAVSGRMSGLTLSVDEGSLVWQRRPVYEDMIGDENLAFRLFKDGIRAVTFLPGSEAGEVRDFVDLLQQCMSERRDEDILSLFWRRDFVDIQVDYVNLIAEMDEAAIPMPDPGAGAGEQVEDTSEIEEVQGAKIGELKDEGDIAPFVLTESDQRYLRAELKREWDRPLSRDVTLALLDQFEMRDHERRTQVVELVRGMLPRLMQKREYDNVALILTELQLLADKTGEEATQELVADLLHEMSESLAQMVAAAGPGPDRPDPEQLRALLDALQEEAIPTLVRALPRLSDRDTRTQLSNAIDRLVSSNPQQIRMLLRTEDPVVASEATRIVVRLGVQEATPDVIMLLDRQDRDARLAAISALEALNYQGSSERLLELLDDGDMKIRFAAARAIAGIRPPGAREYLEELINDGDLKDRDVNEQLAFFKAYAQVAGDDAIDLLQGLLNGRSMFRKQPASIRATAARALGMIPGDEAGQVLERAANDKNVAVRSAVNAALRARTSGESS